MREGGGSDAEACRLVHEVLRERSMGNRGLDVGPIALIEVCCSQDSSFSAAVAQRGGAALRIVAPRAEQTLLLEPPVMRVGEAVNWELDLLDVVSQKRLLNYIRTLHSVPGTTKFHLHSSPPCTAFTRLNRGCNKERVKKDGSRRWAKMGSLLTFTRVLHAAFKKSSNISKDSTASHEQAAGCSTKRAGAFPWALSPKAQRHA